LGAVGDYFQFYLAFHAAPDYLNAVNDSRLTRRLVGGLDICAGRATLVCDFVGKGACDKACGKQKGDKNCQTML
jgi:hypothetical protein